MADGDLDAIAAADEVIARARAAGPEEVSAAMRSRARALQRLGRTDEAIAAFAALAARFADAPEATVRGRATRALLSHAWLLAEDGRHEEALAGYDAVVARVSGTTDRATDEVAVMAQGNRVVSLLALGREEAAAAAADEALAAYDRHVAAFGAPAEDVCADVLRAVMNKARALWGDGRDPRVLSVYEEVIARARPAPPAQVRSAVVSALLSYGTALSDLGFGERANALPAVVAELFEGDLDEEEREPPAADEPPDDEIAALLARVWTDDAWRWFAAPDRDRPTDELGARAVALYDRTGPVVDGLAGDRDLDSPAVAAALLIRTVASGWAVLARGGSVSPRTRALLPVRSRTELGLRALRLDRWAAEHGHPLDLPPSEEELELELPSPGESPDGAEGFPAAFALAVRTADIVAAARRAPVAAELLAAADLRDRAANAVARAVNWAAWLGQRRPEAAPAGVAMLLLAQGVFAAIWSADPTAAWFPTRDLVRQAVEAADMEDWFEEAGVVLPEWLSER